MQECEQCETAEYDTLTRVRYRWTDIVAGENPRRMHTQYVCDRCYFDLERMVRDRFATWA